MHPVGPMHIHPTYGYPNGLQEGPPSAGRRQAWRWLWRWLWRALAAVLVLLAAVVLAWVVSNWRDADPQPRPPELALPVPRLPADRNVAYALMGLNAAADRDPTQVGRERWAANARLTRFFLTHPAADERAAARAAHADADQALAGAAGVAPAALPWACDEFEADCAARYGAAADALAPQRQGQSVWGARCDAVVDALQPDKGKGYEELLPTDWQVATLPMAGLQSMAFCARWLHTGAALAFRQGRKEEAWRQMARSNQFHRALLAGAHTLISQQVVQGLLRRHLAFVSGLVALDPAWAAQAVPLAAAWGAPEQAARRWLVVESAFGHAALKDAMAPSDHPVTSPASHPPPGWAEQVFSKATQVLTKHHIGAHPERTAQLMDQQWLALLKQVEAGLPAALEAPTTGASAEGASVLRWWRNPLGRTLVEVAAPAFKVYLRRQLDLELHREALALALNLQRLGIAPAARAAWAQQQAVSPALRARLGWSADGHTLQVRSGSADGLAPGEQPSPRDRIQIMLDRPPT